MYQSDCSRVHSYGSDDFVKLLIEFETKLYLNNYSVVWLNQCNIMNAFI